MSKQVRTIIACVLVLFLGVVSVVVLPRLREEPARAELGERPLYVEVIEVRPEQVPVVIKGYGQVRARDVVSIAPEVAGTVIEVAPQLEVGDTIAKGETLFVIDPQTYAAQVADGQALVDQWRHTVERLEIEYESDRARLKTLERTRDLALAEYERLKLLFEADEVGTKAGVEQAERVFNQVRDQVDQMIQALEVYPIRIREARSTLAAAEARLVQHEINLKRTRVAAPFDGRVTSQSLKVGRYVTPGTPVITLADDSVLEVSVPLDSLQARRWLKFNGTRLLEGQAWFSELEPVECKIRWTEDEDHYWVGRLHRVEKFDEQMRSLVVAVRVDGDHALSVDGDGLPLVEGMFCELQIPGRMLEVAYRVPRTAVTFENTVYVAKDDRLRTVPVELAYEQGRDALVSKGLESGDLVVVTRLVNPLENSLLNCRLLDAKETAS